MHHLSIECAEHVRTSVICPRRMVGLLAQVNQQLTYHPLGHQVEPEHHLTCSHVHRAAAAANQKEVRTEPTLHVAGVLSLCTGDTAAAAAIERAATMRVPSA